MRQGIITWGGDSKKIGREQLVFPGLLPTRLAQSDETIDLAFCLPGHQMTELQSWLRNYNLAPNLSVTGPTMSPVQVDPSLYH